MTPVQVRQRDRRIRELHARAEEARASRGEIEALHAEAEAAFLRAVEENRPTPELMLLDRRMGVAAREWRAAHAYAQHLEGLLAGAERPPRMS